MSLNHIILQQNFLTACETASPQEHAIIDQINGCFNRCLPAVTMAEILSLRTCNILLKQGVTTGEILTITSNETVCAECKERLQELTGTTVNNVFTIHSFCEQLVADIPGILPNPLATRLSITGAIALLKKLVDSFPAGHPLKKFRSDVYKATTQLKPLFSCIKKNGYAVPMLLQRIEDRLTAATITKLVPKEAADMEEMIAILINLRAAVNEFENYQVLLQQRNTFDEDDLIQFAIKALEENNPLLTAWLQPFKYFQLDLDTNADRLARKLLDQLKSSATSLNILSIDRDGQTAETSDQQAPAPSSISAYPSQEAELADLTGNLSSLLQQGIDSKRIAVVYTHDDCRTRVEQLLQQHHIPFYSKGMINLSKETFIRKILLLLNYTSNEYTQSFSNDDLLFEILHSDFYHAAPLEIARLLAEINGKKNNKSPGNLRRLLVEKMNAAPKDLFDTGLDKELASITAMLEQLILNVPKMTGLQFFDHLVQEAKILQYINGQPEKAWLSRLLEALRAFIEKESSSNPTLSLANLVSDLDFMQAENWPIYVHHGKGDINGIRLVHISDAAGVGNKFDHVLVIAPKPPPSNSWFDQLYRVNDPILAALNGSTNITAYQKILNLQDVIAHNSLPKLVSRLVPVNQYRPQIAPLPTEFTAPLLRKFVMSVSALNNYLRCPLAFYYQHLLKVPAGKNEALEFGSAVHFALEQLFKKMSAPGGPAQYSFPPSIELANDFRQYMHDRLAHFTPDVFTRRIQYGETILHNYYNRYLSDWNKVVSVERNIQGIYLQGIPLRGKPDKLEFNGRSVTIVDYKTGNIEKALSKLNPPRESAPNGGDYWRQAVFYKMLVDLYPQKDWTVTSIEFDFIEPLNNQYHKKSIIVTPADMATVQQQVIQSWSAIQAHEFYTGCGKASCHWCNFVKDNRVAINDIL